MKRPSGRDVEQPLLEPEKKNNWLDNLLKKRGLRKFKDIPSREEQLNNKMFATITYHEEDYNPPLTDDDIKKQNEEKEKLKAEEEKALFEKNKKLIEEEVNKRIAMSKELGEKEKPRTA